MRSLLQKVATLLKQEKNLFITAFICDLNGIAYEEAVSVIFGLNLILVDSGLFRLKPDFK